MKISLEDNQVDELLVERSVFPWNLTENEVYDILKRFVDLFDSKQPNCYLRTFTETKTQDKVVLRPYYLQNIAKGNDKAYQKFRWMIGYLKQHPSLVTGKVNDAIEGSETLKKIFETRRIVLQPAGDNQVAVTIAEDSNLTPLAREELLKTGIMSKIVDRIDAMLDSMSGQKIHRSSLGTLSRGLENLIKSYSMFKSEGVTNNFVQVNIGKMNLEQKRELSVNMTKR